MRYLFIAVVLGLSACVSTGTLKPQACPTADWHKVGYQDGIRGESAQKILRHTQACPQNPPNRALWEQGRQEGLGKYCTQSHAYELGRMGRTLHAVCEHNLEELHKANLMGLQQYEISERIRLLNNGYLEPWLSPFYPYWF